MDASVRNTGIEKSEADRRVFVLVEVATQREILHVGGSSVHKEWYRWQAIEESKGRQAVTSVGFE